jgi:hypothetical protein
VVALTAVVAVVPARRDLLRVTGLPRDLDVGEAGRHAAQRGEARGLLACRRRPLLLGGVIGAVRRRRRVAARRQRGQAEDS